MREFNRRNPTLGRRWGWSNQISFEVADVRLGSKSEETQHEHMSSGLPLKADIARCSWHVANVPIPEAAEPCDFPRNHFPSDALGLQSIIVEVWDPAQRELVRVIGRRRNDPNLCTWRLPPTDMWGVIICALFSQGCAGGCGDDRRV
jgi:hypothetical protein